MRTAPSTGFDVADADISDRLFDFQKRIVRWSMGVGRAAIWADCGLGKSWMALEWSRLSCRLTGMPGLILTPLAVADQFIGEHAKLGSDAPIRIISEAADVGAGINLCNYEKLHRLNPGAFGSVVLDESSILKNHTGATRTALIGSFSSTPMRLCCTATPSPNDVAELANHAEFLGTMRRAEMLSMFFVHDGGETQKWRLKGHAREPFWQWVCSWAVNLRTPEDIGCDGSAYQLPPLNVSEHVVETPGMAERQGALFSLAARSIHEQRAARRMSLPGRVAIAADMINASSDAWVVWCDLNDESSALAKAIPDAVEVRGSQSTEDKEAAMRSFADGSARVIVTKPSIAGWGMNWQHCAHVAFVGVSHSFEAWYQAIRRTYRFGQRRPVECHIIISDADGAVIDNLRRKQRDAEALAASMAGTMGPLSAVSSAANVAPYSPSEKMTLPAWMGGAA